MKALKCFVCLALLAAATNCPAGWVFHEQREEGTSTTYVEDNFLRSGEKDMITVFDLNAGTLTFWNTDDKSYWTGSPESFKREMRAAMIREMELALERIPGDQREAYRSVLQRRIEEMWAPSGKQASLRIDKTDEKAELAGYPATKYEIWVDGRLREVRWIARIDGLSEDLDPVRLKSFVKAMSETGQEPWKGAPEVLDLLDIGFPMKTIQYDAQGNQEASRITKVKKRSISMDLFRIPSDYMPVELRSLE